MTEYFLLPIFEEIETHDCYLQQDVATRHTISKKKD